MSSNHPFIGIFMNLGEGDREISARIDAFLEGVNSGGVGPGPVPGLTIALRFGNADFGNYQTIANELYNLRVDGAGPDLYFTTCWPSLRILWAFPRPVVFAGIPWIGTTPPYPNNVYGFVSAGANVCREWVALLNDITQGTVKRVGVIFDDDKNRPDARNRIWTEISNQAATCNITPTPINCGSGTLDQDIKAFAQAATTPAGLIVAMSALTAKRREVVTLAARICACPRFIPTGYTRYMAAASNAPASLPGALICRTCTARPAVTPDNSSTTTFRTLRSTKIRLILLRRSSRRSSTSTQRRPSV